MYQDLGWLSLGIAGVESTMMKSIAHDSLVLGFRALSLRTELPEVW